MVARRFPPHRSLGWMRKCGYGAIATVMVLVLLEGGARIFGNGEDSFLYDTHPRLLWIPQRSQTMRVGPHRAITTINSQGYRGAEVSPMPSPGTRRIVIIGDSVAFGFGAPDDATYPYLLQEALQREIPEQSWEVVNAAVPGYSAAQIELALEIRALPLQPTDVIYGFCLNDGRGITTPQEVVRGMLFRSWLQYSVLYKKWKRWYLERRRASAFPDAAKRTKPEIEQGWRGVRGVLAKIARTCEGRGVRYGLVVFPSLPQLQHPRWPGLDQKRLRAYGREDGYPVLDLLPGFRERVRSGVPPQAYFIDQFHLTRQGASRATELTVESWPR